MRIHYRMIYFLFQEILRKILKAILTYNFRFQSPSFYPKTIEREENTKTESLRIPYLIDRNETIVQRITAKFNR